MQRNSSAESIHAETSPPIYASSNYVGDHPGRPLFHTSDPTRSRLVLDPHQVAIRDTRSLSAPSLDREGFRLFLQQPLPRLDYKDSTQRDGPYLIQLQELVRSALKADRVISDTSVVRLPGAPANQVPVLLVHCDFTPKIRPVAARRMLGSDTQPRGGPDRDSKAYCPVGRKSSETDRRYGRVIALNVWRPISMPPHDVPLAVCKTGSLADTDIQVSDFIEEIEDSPPYQGELSLCRYNSAHEWFCVSDMTPDEVPLFIGYDHSDPGKCGAMHNAFRDPSCPPGAPGRASIEVRMFAFFE